MPELPDIEAYLYALRTRIELRPLLRVRLASPFLLRSVDPPLRSVETRTVTSLRRLGKRIVFEFDNQLFLVLHLMIAGRLQWRDPDVKVPGKLGLAAFDFPDGSLLLTEAGSKKRASLYVVRGETGLKDHDPGGIDVFEVDQDTFAQVLTRENRTLKRALTDPRIVSGVGNAYSDEILHHARMSPFKRSWDLSAKEAELLFDSSRAVLSEWTARFVAEARKNFPKKVTAFRPEMAVHGKYGQPCPDCRSPVQRIIYAQNEANYCAGCQTGGKLLADRVLSKLMKEDWPKTLEELEERRGASGLAQEP